jgi:hypothetical protein
MVLEDIEFLEFRDGASWLEVELDFDLLCGSAVLNLNLSLEDEPGEDMLGGVHDLR